ncbi:unnamed protein product, partial [Meganyctiphanes norvegica]
NDGGLLDRLKRKWWGKTKTCKIGNKVRDLGFEHTFTAFLPLVAGAIISSLTLFIEYKFHKSNDSSYQNDAVKKSEVSSKDDNSDVSACLVTCGVNRRNSQESVGCLDNCLRRTKSVDNTEESHKIDKNYCYNEVKDKNDYYNTEKG